MKRIKFVALSVIVASAFFVSCASAPTDHPTERRDELEGTTWRWANDLRATTTQIETFSFLRGGRYSWQWLGATGMASHAEGTYILEGDRIILNITERDGRQSTGSTVLIFFADRHSFSNTQGQVFNRDRLARTTQPFAYPFRAIHIENGPVGELMIGVYANSSAPRNRSELSQIMAHPVSRDRGTTQFSVNMRFSIVESPRLVILYKQEEDSTWTAIRFTIAEFTDADFVTIDWQSMTDIALFR